MNLEKLGSQTAKNGFQNEKDIVNKFNNWKVDVDAKIWLSIMKYSINEIENVIAEIIHGEKTDVCVNISVKIKFKKVVECENIQVKLVSNKKGFNQIDKRWLSSYQKLWNIPPDIFMLLQFFTGEVKPNKLNLKDKRRMFVDEFFDDEKKQLIQWFEKNYTLILSDVIKGRGKFSAEWVLVAQKIKSDARWTLKNINEVLSHYSQGGVKISPKGSILLGRITIQRKGGDGGRKSANMLQFKLDPTELFD